MAGRKKSRFACLCEYALLRTACGVVNAIPYPVACGLARALASVAVSCGFKKKRTLERIRGCFPEKSRAEALAIAKFSLANVLLNAVEMIRAPRLTKDWITRHVEDIALYSDRLRAVIEEGKGAVIMVPHSGNWYMAAWAMAKYGLPLFAIAARQRNPKLNAWMNRQYGDIEVLDRDNRSTLIQIHQRLRDGRAFAILPDLRVRNPDVEVDFLGGRANVSHAGAAFAVNSGCPIVLAVMTRENGRHVFHYLKALRPDPAADKKEETRRLTREALKLLSDEIVKHPGDWYWYNKRWILEPVKK